MISQVEIGKLIKISQEYTEVGTHDWDHTYRVYKMCMNIGKIEKANLTVLAVASLLHDIGRKDEKESGYTLDHAIRGAEIARPLLSGFDLTKDEKRNILSSIRSHRSKNDLQPETLEAKILYDADKLDALGAIGVGRFFHFSGGIGAKVQNTRGINIMETKEYSEEDTAYREYLIKFKDKTIEDIFTTKEAKRISYERKQFMDEFFEKFNKEIEGIN